jgi:hypothetical protein
MPDFPKTQDTRPTPQPNPDPNDRSDPGMADPRPNPFPPTPERPFPAPPDPLDPIVPAPTPIEASEPAPPGHVPTVLPAGHTSRDEAPRGKGPLSPRGPVVTREK